MPLTLEVFGMKRISRGKCIYKMKRKEITVLFTIFVIYLKTTYNLPLRIPLSSMTSSCIKLAV
jgi:hypothetical protein